MTNQRTVDFDSFSGSYDSLRGTGMERLAPWVEETVAYAPVFANDSVIDIGCGTGRYTELFAPGCSYIVGVDRSEGMLSAAVSSDRSRANYVRGNALSLPFPDRTFDCALMFMVVHNFGEDERQALLAEIYRILNDGGRLLVLTNSHARMARSLWTHFPGFLEIDYARFPNLPTLVNDMKAAGFSTGHKSVRKKMGSIRTDDYLRKVSGKYLSTLRIMDDSTFNDGFAVFSEYVRKRFPLTMPDAMEFLLVRGKKRAGGREE